MSVVCRPAGVASLECVSVRAGLTVTAALERACPMLPPLQLKWPNDVMLRGRKLGGILCEARWDGPRLAWLVIGIGLNLLNALPADLVGTSITMAATPHPAAPEVLAVPVAEALAAAGRRAGPLDPTELAAWQERDWLRGRRVTGRVTGLAEGLTPDGALLVREPSGHTQPVSAGEVVLAT
jgi:BirA family biotin operon repressor/biotin-[acetyl-CoA-carboxylase] ligase